MKVGGWVCGMAQLSIKSDGHAVRVVESTVVETSTTHARVTARDASHVVLRDVMMRV